MLVVWPLQTNSIAVKQLTRTFRLKTAEWKKKRKVKIVKRDIGQFSFRERLVERFIEGGEKVAACTRGRGSGSDVKQSLLQREDVLLSSSTKSNTGCEREMLRTLRGSTTLLSSLFLCHERARDLAVQQPRANSPLSFNQRSKRTVSFYF